MKKLVNKKMLSVFLAVCVLMSGCAQMESQSGSTENATGLENTAEAESTADAENKAGTENTENLSASSDEMFTERDISGDYSEKECINIKLEDGASVSDSKSVGISGDDITITDEGTYLIKGGLKDGCLIVEADESDKIQLVFAGVSIKNADFAPVYIKKADKVFITLAAGTENELYTEGTINIIDDNNVDSVIFSKEDLTLNGEGSLKIETDYGHGIVSKDDLKITNGTYIIKASNHALSGKNSVRIRDGVFELTAGKDGIHSEDKDDISKGYIYIENGDFNISAVSDGMDAVQYIDIIDGNIVISECEEGLEGKVLNLKGGTVDITSADDALNAAFSQSQTSSVVGTGADGAKNDGSTGQSSDDAAQDGKMTFDRGQKGGGMEAQEGVELNITGGEIYIDAEGDGIDSNGDLNISGGKIYVKGPESSGNGALDYAGSAVISGGIIIAAGNGGMAMNFGEDSTQCSMLVSFSGNFSGGTISLKDSGGNEIIAWTTEKGYNSVVISCPDIKQGEAYTVTSSPLSEGGNSETVEVAMDSVIYGSGNGMGHGGGGFGGRQKGDIPSGGGIDGNKMPHDGNFKGGRGGDIPSGGGIDGNSMPPKPDNREMPEDMDIPDDGEMI